MYLRFCLFNLNFWCMAICTCTPTDRQAYIHTVCNACSATSVGLAQACPNYLQGICFSCGFLDVTVSTHSTLCYSSSKIWLLSNIQQAWSGKFGHTCEIQGMCTYWQKCYCSQWMIFILYIQYLVLRFIDCSCQPPDVYTWQSSIADEAWS